MSFINAFGGRLSLNDELFAGTIWDLGECSIGPYRIISGNHPIWESLELYYGGDLLYKIQENTYGDHEVTYFTSDANLLMGVLINGRR